MAQFNFQVFQDGGAYDSMPVITPILWESCRNGTADREYTHDGMTFYFLEFRGAECVYGYHGAALWEANSQGEKLIRISLLRTEVDWIASTNCHKSLEDAEQRRKNPAPVGIVLAKDEFATMMLDEMVGPYKAVTAPNTGLMRAAELQARNSTYGKFASAPPNLRDFAKAAGIDLDELIGKETTMEIRKDSKTRFW